MSLKIEVEVPYDLVVKDQASTYLERAMSAIGFHRELRGTTAMTPAEDYDDHLHAEVVGEGSIDRSPNAYWKNAEAPASKPDQSKRERGKPSAGRARRTKEEIAEDEAADAADAARAEAATDANIQAEGEDDVKLAISTDDERIGPDDEQDAADEAAEAEANRKDGAVTHDDLRKALGAYQKAFGMAAAVAAVGENGLIGCTVDKVPDDHIAAMIGKVEEAIAAKSAGEPEKVEKVEKVEKKAEPAKDAPARTRDDVKALMEKYVAMYGMDAFKEDGPKIFNLALGDVPPGTKNSNGVEVTNWSLGAVPDNAEAFAKCFMYWTSALRQAPESYGRKKVS